MNRGKRKLGFFFIILVGQVDRESLLSSEVIDFLNKIVRFCIESIFACSGKRFQMSYWPYPAGVQSEGFKRSCYTGFGCNLCPTRNE